MDREQALRLWLSTLECRTVPPRAAAGPWLAALWDGVDLSGAERAQLEAALEEPDETLRRERYVRATRRILAARGLDVDLLTTPAARMRGL